MGSCFSSSTPSSPLKSSTIPSQTPYTAQFGQPSSLPLNSYVNKIHEITSQEEFNKILNDPENVNILILCDFHAVWCSPCLQIAPILRKWSLNEYKSNVIFLKIDVDQNNDLSNQFSINLLPTFVLFKQSEEIDRLSGTDSTNLRNKIDIFILDLIMKLLFSQHQFLFLSRLSATSVTTNLSNACDCHVHIIDSSLKNFPQISNRLYTAASAPLTVLQKLASSVNIDRFVLVQPSFYGTDNRCLLQALDQLGNTKGRGVIVIDPARTKLSQLEYLHTKGVRGIRLNLHSLLKNSSNHSNKNFDEQLVNLVKQMNNWHIQLFASMKTIILMKKQIEQIAPLPIVIDHYGMPDDLTSSSDRQAFLDLMESQSHLWIKVSAPYRLSKINPVETQPPKQWLKALIEKIPDRCVWGSDWPHTPEKSVVLKNNDQQTVLPYRSLDYQQLYEDFINSINNSSLIQKIFVTNPQKLYDF